MSTNGNDYHAQEPRFAGLLEQQPPFNLEAERGLIGSVLLDNSRLAEARRVVASAADFFRASHQVLWHAICRLDDAGTPVDCITLAEELERRGQFAEAGGDDYLREVIDGTPHAVNALHYADIVRQKAKARAMVDLANETLRAAYRQDLTADQLYARTADRFAQIESGVEEEALDLRLRPWPDEPDPVVWHSLAGEIVRLIAPHTEADPIAILAQLLAGFGSIVGRRPHWTVEATRHGCNLFVCVVGNSSKARKGTSWDHVRRLLAGCDPTWDADRVLGGLSSGEGMIWTVRDAVYRREKVPGVPGLGGGGYQEAMIDPGINDKRALFVETEFGSTLAVLARDGNTLSGLLRQAWDSGNLRSSTKNNPAKATGAHVSVIGHVTCEELHRRLTANDAANGFANRFLWVCARRSQYLPRGGSIGSVNFADAYRRLNAAVEFATDDFVGGESGRLVRLDDAAGELWDRVYPELSEPKPGLLGAVVSRAEAQTMRLACLYALLDCSEWIGPDHLRAALALWRYCEESAAYVFGDALGDPDAEKLLKALRHAGDGGLTLKQIRRQVFHGHRSTEELAETVGLLARSGLARMETIETAGRPATRWKAVQDGCNTGGAP